MFGSSRITGREVLVGVAGAAILVTAAAAVARYRRTTREMTSTSATLRNELLRTPSLQPDVMEILTDDGATLHVQAYGPQGGEPIVLSHGWACSCEYWYPQVNALAGEYRVITYDQRGHGRSTAGSLAFSPGVLGDDLSAVLKATVPNASVNGHKKAVIVGHSMGGMSVMAWAGRHPDQVNRYASAVLLASTACDRLIADTTVLPLPNRFPRVPVPVGRALLSSPVPLVSSPATTRALQYAAMSPNASRDEVQFCEKIVRDCDPRIRGNWGAALSGLDIHEALENLSVPTTVLVGSGDRLTPPVHSRRLARMLDEAGNLERLVVLPGVGHMSSVENIDEFDREIVHLRNL
ncbi:alpha/beta hydrolase [Rhodococcus sp. WMMA185]|uniref:alpha/beta fold hydrolase n=1 Tax=Rhodococcus sp. WMMA185 TaxID=679318 RepID=UPI0008781AF6|nr:alpha/beta hydrolase [Rhodococcus sp. WMMA185]AOW93239.1 alpha/beta hydrolase [Rhodococcus sp. WMMA185]